MHEPALTNRQFVGLLAMTMAMTALAIDVMLPAFEEIRAAVGLPPGSPDTGRLVTTFFIGLALGQIPAGVLSDHFGRKPVLHAGLALYALGAIGTLLAPTLGWMLIARFAWGLGAALPRVTAVAIVRDRFAGDAMARIMSLVMATFLMVPVIAPAIGAGLLLLGPWQLVFGFCAVAATALNVWVRRLPESLPPERRRPLRLGPTIEAGRIVARTPQTVLLALAMTAAMAALTSYIAVSELVIDEVLGLDGWFPLVFGGLALGMGIASYANSRLVARIGMWAVLQRALVGYLALGVVLAAIVVAGGGAPSWIAVVPVLALLLACHSLLVPNMNSAAMEPVGHVAGTASALLGAVTIAGGSLVATRVEAAYDGTMRPLAWTYVATAVVALGCFALAHRRTDREPVGVPTELDVPAG